MEGHVYKIRGHHFLLLVYFLHDDKLSRDLDAIYATISYGKEFLDFESKIWEEFVEGKCKIEFIEGYDKLCLETGCHKTPKKWCVGQNVEEDREFAEIAGLKIGKPYIYEDIKRMLHRPDWYLIELDLRHAKKTGDKEMIDELTEVKAEIEKSGM